MPVLGQDIETVFLAARHSDPGLEALFALTTTGDVIEVYDPNKNLPQDALQGQIVQDSALQIGDALYFVQVFQYGNPDDGYRNETSIARLNKDGTVDTLTTLPGEFANTGGGAVFALNGAYCLRLGITGFDFSEVFSVDPDGTLSQLTHLGRPSYPGVLPGMATVNSTIFVIGDQQTPLGPNELWRIRPNGSQQLVFSDSTSVVVDVESSGGLAWFITSKGNAQARIQTLWNVGESGTAQKVNIGVGQQANFLDTDGGDLILVYNPVGVTGSAAFQTIARVGLDGSLTTLVAPSNARPQITDVCVLGDEVYFTGATGTSGGSFLYRATAGGGAELVSGIGHGAPDPDVNGLHVSGGKLWFTAAYQVPDGFGGFTVVSVFYSIDSAGVSQVEGGLAGHRSDLFVLQGYDFSLDFADPIIGTAGADLLNGTAAGEVISGLAGNDTVYGGGGDDLVSGGNADDQLDGGRGADVLDGGLGNDVLVGGPGNDTLTGGAGRDTFQFDFAPDKRTNLDTITDFASGLDRIDLAMAAFPGLTGPGPLGADLFWSGAGVTRAHDATDRLIYNTATGTLYYDADGIGGVRAVKIAELGALVSLDHTDIAVFD